MQRPCTAVSLASAEVTAAAAGTGRELLWGQGENRRVRQAWGMEE